MSLTPDMKWCSFQSFKVIILNNVTDFVLQVKMIVSESISATDSKENYLKDLVLYKKKLDNFHRPLVQSTHYFVIRPQIAGKMISQT